MLHEVLHVIYDALIRQRDRRGNDVTPMDEEVIVEKMSVGLATVFRDNPGLVAWVQTCLNE